MTGKFDLSRLDLDFDHGGPVRFWVVEVTRDGGLTKDYELTWTEDRAKEMAQRRRTRPGVEAVAYYAFKCPDEEWDGC